MKDKSFGRVIFVCQERKVDNLTLTCASTDKECILLLTNLVLIITYEKVI